MINTWEEPNHAAPGAAYGELQPLLPEDVTTLVDDSRLLFERGIANWRTVRVPNRNAASTITEASPAAYLSLIDACLVWSREDASSALYANVVVDSGSSVYPYNLTYTNTHDPLTVIFAERVSTGRLVAAIETTDSPQHQIWTSDDGGEEWTMDAQAGARITKPAVMPGGTADKVILFGFGNQFTVFDTAATVIAVTGNAIDGGAHNHNGTVLLVGEVNGKRSSDFGVTWNDWVVQSPSGTNITDVTLVDIAYDQKRTEFVIVRRAKLSGVDRLFYATSGDGDTWSPWRLLPSVVTTTYSWITLRVTPSGIWMLYYLRADPSGRIAFVCVSWSLDQGLTWRSARILTLPIDKVPSQAFPTIVPATEGHGSYVVMSNPYDDLALREDYELLISGPLEPGLFTQSTIP